MRSRTTEPPSSRVVRRLALGGMTLTEGMHARGSTLPWHDHDGPTLCFVLDGAFAEYARGKVIDCRPSTFKITPAGERHWNRFHLGDVHGLMVELDTAARPSLEPFEQVLTRPHQSDRGAESFLLRRLHTELRAEDDAAALAIEGLLLELLALVARSREPAGASIQPWVARARTMLGDAPAHRLSLADIADEVGVHPATLARAFRRAYGCSLGEMQRRIRLDLAVRLMTTTRQPLAAIAQQAGFFDQSHFTNVFRRHLGTSPHRYRQAARGGLRYPG